MFIIFIKDTRLYIADYDIYNDALITIQNYIYDRQQRYITEETKFSQNLIFSSSVYRQNDDVVLIKNIYIDPHSSIMKLEFTSNVMSLTIKVNGFTIYENDDVNASTFYIFNEAWLNNEMLNEIKTVEFIYTYLTKKNTIETMHIRITDISQFMFAHMLNVYDDITHMIDETVFSQNILMSSAFSTFSKTHPDIIIRHTDNQSIPTLLTLFSQNMFTSSSTKQRSDVIIRLSVADASSVSTIFETKFSQNMYLASAILLS